MESLNKIELRGNVGNVRLAESGGSKVANFSLATNYLYKNRDGEAAVETTWHNVVAWEVKGMPDLSRIQKGVPVYVCGRMRQTRYTGADGTEKQIYEVVANKLLIPDGLGTTGKVVEWQQ